MNFCALRHSKRQSFDSLNRTPRIIRELKSDFGANDPGRRYHLHRVPIALGVAGNDSIIEATEHRLGLVFTNSVDDRQFAFPWLTFAGAQDDLGAIRNLSRNLRHEPEALTFLYDPIALININQSARWILDRQPRGENTTEAGCQKRPVVNRKSSDDQHRDEGEKNKAAESFERNNILCPEWLGGLLGHATGFFAQRLGPTQGRPGIPKLHRRHQQALHATVLLLHLKGSVRSVVSPEVLPATLPRFENRDDNQGHQDHNAPCRRKVEQPIHCHTN